MRNFSWMANAILVISMVVSVATGFAGVQPIKNHEALVETVDIDVKPDGSAIYTHERVLKVLTELGRSELALNHISIEDSGEFRLLEGYSLTGGKKNKVNPSSVHLSTQKSTSGYGLSSYQEAIVAVDNLSIGSEVHLRYQITVKPSLGKLFSSSLILSNSTLAKIEWYRFRSAQPLLYHGENLESGFTVLPMRSGAGVILEVRPDSRAYELSGMRNQTAFLMVSNARSWKQIEDEVASRYLREMNAPLPLVFQSVLVEARSRLQKSGAAAAIEYVVGEVHNRVGYSGNWVTQEGKYFPKSLALDVQQGKGDCKDYATLTAAVLKNLGFEAYPALTFRSQSYAGEARLKELAGFPSAQIFNHAIVWAKDQSGKTWWLDPTNPYFRADTISYDILGNFGLKLDGRADTVTFLPSLNAAPADITLEQTLSIAPDDSVNGDGSVVLSPSNFNVLAMAERERGSEGLKALFALMLNPLSTKTSLELKPAAAGKLGYDYRFHAADWAHEEMGKYKAIAISNATALESRELRRDGDSDLGEPGTVRFVTHIRGQKEIDAIRPGCLVRSPWLDIDRVVENTPAELLVVETVKTKARFIAKSEAKGEAFESLLADVGACAKNGILILGLNDSLKGSAFEELAKMKGPPLETMNDADAEAMKKVSGPQLYSYMGLKLFRYFEKKALKNPADAKAFYEMGQAIRRLGYLHGTVYLPGFLEEGLRDFDRGLAAKPDPELESKINGAKVTYYIYLHRLSEAYAVFQDMEKRLPNTLATYRAGYLLTKEQKRFADAEKWLKATEAFCKTDEDKSAYLGEMYDLYYAQKRYGDAIPFAEKLVQQDPKNPWASHNLALLYLTTGEYEKCITAEKNALTLGEFGLAKKTISQAYMAMARSVGPAAQRTRQPGSYASVEDDMLQAVKYDPRSIDALTSLGAFYAEKYQKNSDRLALQTGKSYVLQAVGVASTNAKVQALLRVYKKLDPTL